MLLYDPLGRQHLTLYYGAPLIVRVRVRVNPNPNPLYYGGHLIIRVKPYPNPNPLYYRGNRIVSKR